jgi:hypothetical protein
MKLTQEYEGWCKVYYGYNLSWKPWILYWEQDTYSRIYIVYDSNKNIIYHYNNETKTIVLDCYHEDINSFIEYEAETTDKFYTRHIESKNTNYRTKYIFITRILS